jgi:phosphatidylglycerophosphate synthase
MEANAQSYHCEDRSIILPVLNPLVWEPLSRLVSARIHPNLLTVAGCVVAWIALAWALVAPQSRPAMLASAAATLFYLTTDCIDGKHARRTGQVSPLGEFLDHWLDSITVPLIALGVCVGSGFPGWVTLLLVGAASATYVVIYWEQYWLGTLMLGRIGQAEMLLASAGIFIYLGIFGPGAMMVPSPLGGLSWGTLFCCLVAGASLITMLFGSVARGREHLRDLAPHALSLALVCAWYAIGHLGLVAAGLLLVLATALHCEHVLVGRVLREPYRSRAPLAAIGLVVGLGSGVLGFRGTPAMIFAAVLGLALCAEQLVRFRRLQRSLETAQQQAR